MSGSTIVASAASECQCSRKTGDRFIASRSAMDIDVSHHVLCASDEPATHKILAFKNKAPVPESHPNHLRVVYSQNAASTVGTKKTIRHVPTAPERTLDAPELPDDYYLNVMDWSSQNQLAVALGTSVYILDASSSDIQRVELPNGASYKPTAVNWTQEGKHLAIGTQDGQVLLYDVIKSKVVRSMKGHMGRVPTLAWNNFVLSSGSSDTFIFNHDVRQAEHHISTFHAHTQEVCGLRWSHDGTQLASGANDNVVCIWDAASLSLPSESIAPRYKFTEHNAAVKALAWCPWQSNLLASGGGTSDRCIRTWNTAVGSCLNVVDTKSQVSSLLWSKHSRELVSGHGYSMNQVSVWQYPTMTKVADLTGHTSRVLQLAMSPDGTTVVSAGADESLRFWKIFEPASRNGVEALDVDVKKENSAALMHHMNIR